MFKYPYCNLCNTRHPYRDCDKWQKKHYLDKFQDQNKTLNTIPVLEEEIKKLQVEITKLKQENQELKQLLEYAKNYCS